MAIKVKHEGSVASRLAAGAEGGRAKRAMEAAALAKPSQIQTLQPAHASAPGISAPHAPLIAAPGGGAHAPLIGGGGGIGATAHLGGRGGGGAASRVGTSGGGDSGDYKVTGTSIFDRPDKESVWNDQTRQWIRKWLPGEKEAEALDRVGTVRNMQRKDIEGFLHGLLKDRAEQSSLLTTERNVMSARLKAMLGAPTVPGTAVKSPFSDAPADTGAGDTGDALDKQQTAVMSELDDIAADARAKSGLPQQPEQSDDLKMLVDSIAGQSGEVVADAGGDTPDDIAGVYANGGSIFGGQDGGDGGNALAWLRPDESAGTPSVGDDSAAADEFASSIGGLINALMRKGSNYV